MIKPTIVYQSTDSKDELSVWPAIPGVTANPAIQIDHGRKSHRTIEFRIEDAAALAQAILSAAAESALKRP